MRYKISLLAQVIRSFGERRIQLSNLLNDFKQIWVPLSWQVASRLLLFLAALFVTSAGLSGCGGASLKGAASTAGTANLQVSSSNVLFGSVAVGKAGISSIAFGSANLNTPSTQSVTLTSTGTTAVTVSNISITGTGFTESGATLPLTLNPNQTAVLNITFNPTVAGTVTGQLTISSNSSSGSTTSISLTGTGQAAAHEVDLSWSAPASSPDPVAGYIVLRAPTGSSAYQQLNAALVAPSAYVDSTVQSGQSFDYIVESVGASGNVSAPSNIASAAIP
jgi:hypothetical protein